MIVEERERGGEDEGQERQTCCITCISKIAMGRSTSVVFNSNNN